jgi:hypothetical protein
VAPPHRLVFVWVAYLSALFSNVCKPYAIDSQ